MKCVNATDTFMETSVSASVPRDKRRKKAHAQAIKEAPNLKQSCRLDLLVR
jgi:hypothetical protein